MKLGPQYRPLIIKDYTYWTLVLNEKQYYPGKCYAWWKDNYPAEGEGLRPSDLPPDAGLELNRTIFADVERACATLGYTTLPYKDKFLLNMEYLANLEAHNHHMHWHFIPRSKHSISLPAINLFAPHTDWGERRREPRNVLELPPRQLEYIRSRMAEAIAASALA